MKKYIFLILIMFSTFLSALAETPVKSQGKTGIIVYYFYNNYRCPSCKKIEAYTKEAVNLKFTEDIKKGTMIWQMINVDEPANKHYVNEYKLFTKQVILAEMKQGKVTRSKNLDKIWELLGNKDKFESYIESEIRKFKGEV